jgi:hypothetical protein
MSLLSESADWLLLRAEVAKSNNNNCNHVHKAYRLLDYGAERPELAPKPVLALNPDPENHQNK